MRRFIEKPREKQQINSSQLDARTLSLTYVAEELSLSLVLHFLYSLASRFGQWNFLQFTKRKGLNILRALNILVAVRRPKIADQARHARASEQE